MKILIAILLLAGSLNAQIAPPSKMVKKRHGQTTRLWWDYTPDPTFQLQYFSVKATYDLNATPVEIATAAPTAREKIISAVFTPQYPKYVYFVVTSISQGPNGRVESINSRTVGAERIGPPPN